MNEKYLYVSLVHEQKSHLIVNFVTYFCSKNIINQHIPSMLERINSNVKEWDYSCAKNFHQTNFVSLVYERKSNEVKTHIDLVHDRNLL